MKIQDNTCNISKPPSTMAKQRPMWSVQYTYLDCRGSGPIFTHDDPCTDSQGKDPHSKVWFLPNVYRTHSIVKFKNFKSNHHTSGTVWIMKHWLMFLLSLLLGMRPGTLHVPGKLIYKFLMASQGLQDKADKPRLESQTSAKSTLGLLDLAASPWVDPTGRLQRPFVCFPSPRGSHLTFTLIPALPLTLAAFAPRNLEHASLVKSHGSKEHAASLCVTM